MRTRFLFDGKVVGDVAGVMTIDDFAPGHDGYTAEHYRDADDVRAEASRRMQEAFGARSAAHLDQIIANANREAIRLLRKGSANWTAEEATRAAELEGADLLVEAIRASSNAIEPLNPIPDDYADDSRWPATGGA